MSPKSVGPVMPAHSRAPGDLAGTSRSRLLGRPVGQRGGRAHPGAERRRLDRVPVERAEPFAQPAHRACIAGLSRQQSRLYAAPTRR